MFSLDPPDIAGLGEDVMALSDILWEDPPKLPREIDDKKLADANKRLAADLWAFQAKVKGLEKEVRALEKSIDKLYGLFDDAKTAKHGKDARTVRYPYEIHLGKLMKD